MVVDPPAQAVVFCIQEAIVADRARSWCGNTNSDYSDSMASSLDTTGLWDAGDDLRIMNVLMVPFGTYTLDCVGKCCNTLEDMSPEAVTHVKTLLDQYDAANEAESNQNLGDTEGKVLVKADVLEWQVTGVGQPTGPQKEQSDIRAEIARYFQFCVCLHGYLPGNELPGGGIGTAQLYRS